MNDSGHHRVEKHQDIGNVEMTQPELIGKQDVHIR